MVPRRRFGRHADEVLDPRRGRLPSRPGLDHRRGGADRPRRHRRRHDLPRQRLGVPRGRERRAHGPRHPRPAGGRVPDDQGVHARPRRQGRDATARTVAAPPADRLPRPVAGPRVRLRQRPGAPLRRRRRHRGARPGEAAGQGALRRLHRAQGPGDPPRDAVVRLSVRRLPAAAQRLRRQLPQLPAPGAAGAGTARHRRHRHEEPGRQRQGGEEARRPHRGRAALRDEPAGVHHRLGDRLDERAAAQPEDRSTASGR